MAARITPAGGSKPDLVMREAILEELDGEDIDEAGLSLRRARLIARKLIEKAKAGDVAAIKVVLDRMDGRASEPVVPAAGVRRIAIRWLTEEEAAMAAAGQNPDVLSEGEGR